MQTCTSTNFLGDDGLTRPTSNNGPTMHNIFTLKSSNSVHTVQFINTFYHFLIQMWKNFMPRCPSRHQPIMVTMTITFIEKSSLSHCQPRLKSNPPALDMETTLSGIKLFPGRHIF